MKTFLVMDAIGRVLLRTDDTHISKLLCEYSPSGGRNIGRPKKRRTEQLPLKQKKPGMTYTLLLLLM